MKLTGETMKISEQVRKTGNVDILWGHADMATVEAWMSASGYKLVEDLVDTFKKAGTR